MAPPSYPPGGHENGQNGNQYTGNVPLDPSLMISRPHSSQPPHLAHLPPPYVIPRYQHPPQDQSYPPHHYPAPPPQPHPRQQQPAQNDSTQSSQGKEKRRASPKSTPVTGNAGPPVPAKRGRPSKKAAASNHVSNPGSEHDPTYPSIMVYPPPPPPPGERYNPSPLFSQPGNEFAENRGRDAMHLPSMGSWAPPSTSSPRTAAARGYDNQPSFATADGWSSSQPGPRPQMPSDQSWAQQGSFESTSTAAASRSIKREREDTSSTRPLSDPGEVEASLALAGLKRRDSAPMVKKAKKEKEADAKPKKGDKDGKKSCAECRRLKAKCDRVFPCSNCRRRGCALVCPDGDLSCMQGKRLVLASTEQLHERIAQLESALFQSHGKTATGHHPLLAPEYLDGGFASLPPPLQQSPIDHSPKSGTNSNADIHRSPHGPSSASSLILATPQLSAERGSSQGRMAVESLLLTEDAAAPEGKREDEWAGENAAPAMIIGTVGNQPSDDLDERHQVFERLKKILKVLPPREEVQRRAKHFWDTSVWYQTVLRAEEFDAIYEPAVFAPTPANPLSPHKLAVVLIVLTLDCYLDLNSEEEDSAVATYWDAVQRCFDTRFGWAASVAGVQALALATLFVGFGWRGARASNFYWLRQMTSAAMQLGLHRDPHPSLPEEEREFRRRVFHEIFVLDCLICLNHGQRTAIPIEYIETAYPKDTSALSLKKYEFMKLVKTQVIDIGCLPDTSPASWEKVDAVKQRLMQFDVSSIPQIHCPLLRGEAPPSPVEGFSKEDGLALQTTTTSMCHYKAMLYLFRPALRRLVARLRAQPRESIVFDDADRECVSMTYRACHAITLTSYYMARKHPKLMGRCWMVWVQTFSAAVSMAALAIWCGPHLESTFVSSAYQELSEACDMIGENGSTRSLGVLSLLPILKVLVSNRYPQVIGKTSADVSVSQEGEDMLFALLGGHVDGRDTTSSAPNSTLNTPSVVPGIPGQGDSLQPQVPQPSQQQLQQPQEQPQQQQQQQQFKSPPQTYLGADGTQIMPFQAPMMNPNAAPEAYAVGPYAQPNAGWFLPTPAASGDIVLPLAQSAPSAIPFGINNPASQNSNQNQTPNGNAGGNGTGNGNINIQGLDMVENPTELWARLQTFYEPTPVFWGPTELGGGVSAGIGNGFVDYSGPMF
ncbi:hypothetical protein I317_01760 [Kwoniella heveanensis CBS 569]|nr:hypothetical protein I317_01760 [Kwoniella heveanensis CBS 569]